MLSKNLQKAAVVAAVTGTFGSVGVYAQEVKEITVTATKVERSTQDIPVAVNALDSGTLEELNVANFADYVQDLPGVTAGGSGPGQNTIYIRGLASTTPNLTVAGVAGLTPNVALYLDEQPLTQPGRNLDVYSVDLNRVEVLPGPQGTLFGASAQAGVIRLITNKPKLNQFEAKANFGISFTEDGEISNKVEGIINIPLIEDTLAVRAVGFVDDQGGYIDNVQGTRTTRESARFRPAGTVRDNGVPVSDFRAGVQAAPNVDPANNPVNDPDVTFLEADNSDLVEDDFNDTTYSGGRLMARWAIDSEWMLTVSHMRQQLDSDGVFFTDPKLGDLEVQRFEDDDLEDEFDNTSWTLEGRLAMLDVLYTGAFTNRDTDQTVDYTDYMFVGQYFPYYTCDSSVTYPYDGDPAGTCQPPNALVNSTTETDTITQELRFTTPENLRIHGTAGVFYSDQEIKERNDFTYFGSTRAEIFPNFGTEVGFPPNFPFQTGFTSDDGPFPNAVIFRNDIKRTDERVGLFGEATFEIIPNTLEFVGGARYYDIEVDLEGGANSSFCNAFLGEDVNAFGTDISDQFNDDGEFTFRGTCGDALGTTFTEDQTFEEIRAQLPSDAAAQQVFNALNNAPDTADTSGVIFKATINWMPNEEQLYYATFSEGFRSGLLNRPGGAPGPGDFTVPFELDTDNVNNWELGWKLDLFDQSLRFNGNAFFVDISDLQTTIFDPNIVNLFFSDNAADAEIFGTEGQFTWLPKGVPGLSFVGAFSVLDTEITEVLTPTEDVTEGAELAFAPTFQGNLRARYEWAVGSDYTAHVMPEINYTGSSRSDIIDINAADVEEYVTVGLAVGIRTEDWRAELYGDNLNNTRGELTNDFVFDRERTTVIRPRTIGLRFSFNM